MSEHQFIVTDIDYQPFREANHTPSSSAGIKAENIKEENLFLLTNADVAGFANDPNSFHIVEDLTSTNQENIAFNIQPYTDAQVVNQILSGDNFTKLPIDLGSSFKIEDIKSDRSLPHYIKYRMQDGKHVKVWECGICLKEFGHQYTLMRHLPTHTDERKFQCNTCGKAFRQMSTLSQHRAIHSAERPYVCEICHKTFNRVSTLISHRKTHTGQKPHQCHLCNKAFHQKGNLRNHIFTHTNERPYKCDVCNKGFNQMSNLMCHKLKAHQRADKPRYTCQICGKDFQKRMGLRNHEQYQHGMQNSEAGTSSDSPRIRYTNGVVVDPINTAAMQHALATNQTPFALLRPLNGIPVLVRVLPAGDKQMLVPATAEDLKKHGQISINPKTEDSEEKPTENDAEIKDPTPDVQTDAEGKPIGSTVQIKIPVVATVIQRCGKDGNMCMAVESPGPSSETSGNENYIFTTTAVDGDADEIVTEEEEGEEENGNGQSAAVSEISASVLIPESQIEFLDEAGNVIAEDDFNKTNRYFQQGFNFNGESGVFNQNIQIEEAILDLGENQENLPPNLFKEMQSEEILNMDGGNIFKMLDKQQDGAMEEAENMMEATSVLYNNGSDFMLQ